MGHFASPLPFPGIMPHFWQLQQGRLRRAIVSLTVTHDVHHWGDAERIGLMESSNHLKIT